MTIRPIRTNEDYQAALKRAKALFGKSGQSELDEREVLQALIEKWERSQHSIEAATPAQAIKFRMKQTGLSQRDLIPYLGSKSRVSEILNGQRQPTVDQIRALHQHLGIPVTSLIGSFKHEPAAGPSSSSMAAEEALRKLGVIKSRENLAGFVSRSKVSAPAVAMLRKTRTERTNAKTDLAALEAWCAAALGRAEKVAIKKTKIGDPKKAASVKSTPILVVIGDNAKDHPRWKAIRQHSVNYQAAFKAVGGSLDLVDLPDVGIKGNSHMVMMDRNSDQVADLIQKWLVRKGIGRN